MYIKLCKHFRSSMYINKRKHLSSEIYLFTKKKVHIYVVRSNDVTEKLNISLKLIQSPKREKKNTNSETKMYLNLPKIERVAQV